MGNLQRFLLLFGIICIPNVLGIDSIQQDIWNAINGSGTGKFIPGNNKAIDVSLGVDLIKVSDYDEKVGGVEILIWLKHSYTTPGLSWDPEKFNKVDKIEVPASMLWVPDIVPYQQAGLKANFEPRIVIRSSGFTYYVASYRLPTTCDPDLDGPAFPRDRKRCSIKVGSWVYSSESINLSMAKPSKDKYFDDLLGNWKFIKLTQKFEKKKYDCCTELYPSIEYEIILERQGTYFALSTAVPGIITGLLIVFLFFLPPSSAARIISQTLCLLILVVISMFNLSDFLKANKMAPAARYLIAAMFLDLLAIIWSILASILWIQSEDKGSDGGCIDSLVSKLECICCLPSVTENSSKDGEASKLDQSGKRSKLSAVQRFCLVLDRIFGLIFLILFILLFCCMGI